MNKDLKFNIKLLVIVAAVVVIVVIHFIGYEVLLK